MKAKKCDKKTFVMLSIEEDECVENQYSLH